MEAIARENMFNNFKYKVGFIGGGNMANAIINGLVDGKVVDAKKILVADPYASLVEKAVNLTADNNIAYAQCEFLVFSVKPQIFNTIKGDLKDVKANYAISIMAGINSATIKSALPAATSVIRVMPNTPCKIGAGMVCIADNEMDDYSREFVSRMFNSIGQVEFVAESLFDAVTSISGSGPAYVYMFIDSLIKAGVEGGLPYLTAKKLALYTVIGSAKMVVENEETPIDDMIKAVCSKGGTTIEAVNVFKDKGLDKLVSDAVKACRDRSIELGRS